MADGSLSTAFQVTSCFGANRPVTAVDALWTAESALRYFCLDLAGRGGGTDFQITKIHRAVEISWAISYFSTSTDDVHTGVGAGTLLKPTSCCRANGPVIGTLDCLCLVFTRRSRGTDCQIAKMRRAVEVSWAIPCFSTIANDVDTGLRAGTLLKPTSCCRANGPVIGTLDCLCLVFTRRSRGTDCQIAKMRRAVEVSWAIPCFSTIANDVHTGLRVGAFLKTAGCCGANLIVDQCQPC